MKAVLHVNQHIIKKNKNGGEQTPPLTCKVGKENLKGDFFYIDGPSKLVYRPHKPLKCGATCWIETDYPVKTDIDARFTRSPDLSINVYIVDYGYQVDINSPKGSECVSCRDFGGSHSVKSLREGFVDAFIEFLDKWREDK